jgi:hypothetical protein
LRIKDSPAIKRPARHVNGRSANLGNLDELAIEKVVGWLVYEPGYTHRGEGACIARMETKAMTSTRNEHVAKSAY